MKNAIRTLALTLFVTGIAAGALSYKSKPAASQFSPSTAPIPVCPLDDPNGCGMGGH